VAKEAGVTIGEAIGGILPLAIAVDISVLAIIAVILMLITPRARSNGPAFVAGWVLGLVVVGGLVLIIANAAGVSSGSGPSTAAYVIKLILGVLLLLLAVRQWRSRPGPASSPRRRSGWRPWTASPRSNRSAWVRRCRG
jgi:Sap-like sulfolipid-1-addressing protein